eukprot:TRINITY_DN70131_c0_g1_i1.p1 TRINITY_DN70131_c0_g1~~TRINITY_DN70131_c0_g1_i1.p1  ORF type:complete len:350 (+),score=100.66 TRINITY_DN70131_c0_g1_i1:80-1129(+)
MPGTHCPAGWELLGNLNPFRALGDLLHAASVLIVLYQMLVRRTARGISLKTQVMYAVIFVTRYAPWGLEPRVVWLVVFKAFFICSSGAIVLLTALAQPWRGTYERDADSFRVRYLVAAAAGLAVLLHSRTCCTVWDEAAETLWTFSVYLEAVAILPQLHMLRAAEGSAAAQLAGSAKVVQRGDCGGAAPQAGESGGETPDGPLGAEAQSPRADSLCASYVLVSADPEAEGAADGAQPAPDAEALPQEGGAEPAQPAAQPAAEEAPDAAAPGGWDIVTAHYVCCLGLYRLCYMLNWGYRLRSEGHWSAHRISIAAGIVQAAFYLGFFRTYLKAVVRMSCCASEPAAGRSP